MAMPSESVHRMYVTVIFMSVLVCALAYGTVELHRIDVSIYQDKIIIEMNDSIFYIPEEMNQTVQAECSCPSIFAGEVF